jgi:hypothetical protein
VHLIRCIPEAVYEHDRRYPRSAPRQYSSPSDEALCRGDSLQQRETAPGSGLVGDLHRAVGFIFQISLEQFPSYSSGELPYFRIENTHIRRI